jgi:hypothetical protein
MAKTARKAKRGSTARAGKATRKKRSGAKARPAARKTAKSARTPAAKTKARAGAGKKAAATRAAKRTVKNAVRKAAAVKAKATKAVKKARRTAAAVIAAAKRKTNKPTAPRRTAPAPRAVKAAPKGAVPAAKKLAAAKAPTRKAPGLDRERRTVGEAVVPTPPSSLQPGHASAAKSGADELRMKMASHTGSGPVLTAGDVDADWNAAETIGDEAPGGDNPTPDQDVVDEIGRALGVEYDDDEELQGGDEIAGRDRDRWELDPASSDDFDER